MASIQPRFTDGPRTYEAVETFAGGVVVEARAGGVSNPGCGIAGDASKKVLGVAQKDATPNGNAPRQPVAGVLDQTLAPAEVAVISDGWVPVTYSVACAYGARVCAAANGQVRPWLSADGPDAIIGRCEESAGVAAGAVGLTHIDV